MTHDEQVSVGWSGMTVSECVVVGVIVFALVYGVMVKVFVPVSDDDFVNVGVVVMVRVGVLVLTLTDTWMQQMQQSRKRF
jgi:flagellar biosynthesis protein FliQ